MVGHGPQSQPPLEIAEASSGLCEIIWLIDESVPENVLAARLLNKIGIVVNCAGLSPVETATKLRKYSPDGVVAYRDADIVLLSLVAEELGLDYHTPEVARRLVDKIRQREALRRGGLPTPSFWEIPSDRDPVAVEALAKQVEYPAVLKPRIGGGGQYTMPVANAGDLVSQVALLPAQAGSDGGMFVEQYLPGRHGRDRRALRRLRLCGEPGRGRQDKPFSGKWALSFVGAVPGDRVLHPRRSFPGLG